MVAFQPTLGLSPGKVWVKDGFANGAWRSFGKNGIRREARTGCFKLRAKVGKGVIVATARPPTARPEAPKEDGSEEARKAIAELVREVSEYEGEGDGCRRNSVKVLNGLSEIPNTVSITPVYRALMEAGRLPFFGHAPLSSKATRQTGKSLPSGASEIVRDEEILESSKNDDSRPIGATAPMQDKAVLASRLEEVTGIPPSKLSPQGPPAVIYQLGAIAGLWLLAYIGRQLNIASEIRAGVIGTVAAVTIDQVALGGVVADRVYSALNPGHVKRVVTHEAGHFLLAYLHGLPVQRYALSAWEAVKNRVPGQAATLFADDEFAEQLQKGRVTASAVDRYSVVAMGGIAAEGMILGEALGGDSDIFAMVRLLAGLQPAWEVNQIRVQAKWAVLQAVLLLREYREAYDALRIAMEERRPLGECVMTIEEALKTVAKEGEKRVNPEEKMVRDVETEVAAAGNAKMLEDKISDVDRKRAAVDEELERVERGLRDAGNSEK